MSGAIQGWRFPMNDEGEDDHLNHAGIEDFKNTPIVSLAREICQNSLDARDRSQYAPVEVEFRIFNVKREEFPGLPDYLKRLEACREYQPDSPRTREFFDKALAVAGGSVIPFLFVSDYNTTGCGGVNEKGSDWWKLTKTHGSSDKPGGLGSFGIGKFAPFANSELRTVFYSTMNLSEEVAYQGVARLISHEWDKAVTRGTGYFGVLKKNAPITDMHEIPPDFLRKKPGTTIGIAGFPARQNWENEIIEAVLESFFFAILSERLVVRAGGKVVNKGNIGNWVERLEAGFGVPGKKSISKAPHYIKAMVSSESESFQEPDFKGMGRISLRIITGRDLPKRVAMVRDSGMKIFDKGNFQTAMKFAGVFNAEGEAINQYLKDLEPQQHDKWAVARAKIPEEAEALLKALYAWINRCVREVAERQFSSEADIEGISKYLPDDAEDVARPEDNTKEDFESQEAASSIPLYERTPKTLPKRVEIPAFEAIPDEIDEPADFPEHEDDESDPPNPNPPNPDDGVPSGKTPGTGGAVGAGQGPKKSSTGERIGLSRSRSFGVDRANSVLIVSFTPEADGQGLVALIARGETIQSGVPVVAARLLSTGESLSISPEGRIGPVAMSAGQDHKLEVTLLKPSRFAMEVVIYAD